MTVPKFLIKHIDDDVIDLFVGEKNVGTFRYDEDGWRGMRKAIELFQDIAKAVNAKFEEVSE